MERGREVTGLGGKGGGGEERKKMLTRKKNVGVPK